MTDPPPSNVAHSVREPDGKVYHFVPDWRCP